MKKKLPIGIQSFEEMRTGGWYYVDKTPFVDRLVSSGKYYFLSRPRRFGKSLFLDTLKQAFLGRKELFEGLYLYENWDWDRKYPVVHISFGSGVTRSLEEFRITLQEIFMKQEEEHGIRLTYPSSKGRLEELIYRLFKRDGRRKVVVLVDEYDKPILDVIENKDVALEVREELKNLYSVLKDADPYLKFVFLTGVSKFSKVSLFSGLNQLQDITLNPEYGTICGYTQGELEGVFEPELKDKDLDGIRQWYDGYNWLGENVYNPFDILLYLSEGQFRPYWFETGTPTFLIKLLFDKGFPIPKLESMDVDERLLGSFDVDLIEPENLLFQTGYLTIRSTERIGYTLIYNLSYPNLEVRTSLSSYILDYLSKNEIEVQRQRICLFRALKGNNIDGLGEILQALFNSIPYHWYTSGEVSRYEAYYVSVVYSFFYGSGLDVRTEVPFSNGRIDISVHLEDRCYIFEFKVVEIEPEGRAIEQIKRKGYTKAYEGRFKEVYLIGIEFSKEQRKIVGFHWERA